MRKVLIFLFKIPEILVIGIITFYQKLFSFDHAFWANPKKIRICIYKPSCSEFTKIAIQKHKLIPGLVMGIKRIIDCNPFSKGGLDPVPEKFCLKRYAGLTQKAKE